MNWKILEALSPGYLSSMRRRAAREFQTDWWWDLGEVKPDRLPEFGAAVK